LLIHNRNMVDQIQTEPRGIRAEKSVLEWIFWCGRKFVEEVSLI